MNHIAKYKLTQDFLSESFDEERRYGSKWALIEKFIGAALVGTGIAIFISSYKGTALPFTIVIIGVIELLSNRIKKYFWLRRHRMSKLFEADVEFICTGEGIESNTPFATSKMAWEGIEKVVSTPKGILIWPQKGMYIYLPESIVGKDQTSKAGPLI